MPPRKQKNNKKKQHKNQSQQQKASNCCSSPEASNEQRDKNVDSQLPYKIEESEIVGRYLVASRNLKPGELLITELPLAIGPCVSADAVCLGCYKPVQLHTTQYRCPACAWPLCAAKCRGIAQSDGHTQQECEFHKAHNTAALLSPQTAVAEVKNLYELILIVRILLMKSSDAEKYEKILLMESHMEMRRENAELWRHYEQNIVKRLRQEWNLAERFSEEEIHRICGILDVNCFEIGQNSAKARSLYPSAFLLAHDCSPNTSHTDDPSSYAIILRTSRRIARDEAITLSYAYTLQGTLKRRDFMHAGKLFWCCCERCADPKELDTDCSALICSKCQKGSIRSTDPLRQEADWSCDGCQYTANASDIVKILDAINNNLETIDAHNIPGLEQFLLKYSKVLRPNHYLLLSAKYSLCQIYGRIEGYILHNMSIENIKRKELYCRQFLEVIDKLEPGLTRLRGLIQYELHAPIMVLSQRLMQLNMISRQDFNRNIKEVLKLLRESSEILKMEPVGSSEHEMGLAAEDALQKMQGC